MIHRMGASPNVPGRIYGRPPGQGVTRPIITGPVRIPYPGGPRWTPVTTRPMRPWINRAGLGRMGEGGDDTPSPWTIDYRADGSTWEVNRLTGESHMLGAPTPVVAPAAPKPPPGPQLLGQAPNGAGFVWKLPDGSTVTTPTMDPPGTGVFRPTGPAPTHGTVEQVSPVGPGELFAPQVCPPLCGPDYHPDAFLAQTPMPPLPAVPPPLTAGTSPGTLPAPGYVVAPNFSDPAGTGSPFNATGTTVVTAAPAAAVAGPSPLVLGALAVGALFLLR